METNPLLGKFRCGQALVEDIGDQPQDLHKGPHTVKAAQVMQALGAEDLLTERPTLQQQPPVTPVGEELCGQAWDGCRAGSWLFMHVQVLTEWDHHSGIKPLLQHAQVVQVGGQPAHVVGHVRAGCARLALGKFLQVVPALHLP